MRYARLYVSAPDPIEPARALVRVAIEGSGTSNVGTGVSVLDRLLERLAEYARFDLALEVEPGAAEVEVAEAGTAFVARSPSCCVQTARAGSGSRR